MTVCVDIMNSPMFSGCREIDCVNTKGNEEAGIEVLKAKSFALDIETCSKHTMETCSDSFDSNPRRSLKDIHEGASLILGMERTLFAALNNAWLIALGGIGLMSVGSGDNNATRGGIAMMIGSIICAGTAFGMHFWRVAQLKKRTQFQYNHTVAWALMVAAMTLMTLILEIHFGILYPYLDREKAVTIAEGDG